MSKSNMNMLQYLQSRTQVDFDNLDIDGMASMLRLIQPLLSDVAMGQPPKDLMDAYNELINPHRAGLLKKAAALAHEIHKEYPEVPEEQLAYEIAVLPNITGCILVMANPRYAYSIKKTFDNAQRLYALSTRLQPNFDTSRLIVKVASTWEGLQACRKLTPLGVKTLATTAFSLEQCILAAEVGCVYVSPFLCELKAAVDPNYDDTDPIFDVVIDAQNYYRQHGYPIRMKACAALNTDQILQLAGVDAFTAPVEQLQELQDREGPPPPSFFDNDGEEKANGTANGEVNGTTNGHANGETNGYANGETNGQTNGHANGETNGHVAKGHSKKNLEKISFIDDESAYRLAFANSNDGKGQMKTTQAMNIFSEYQLKAEAMMRDPDLVKIG
ncbi:MAG: hypothetical protein Q9174_006422 [Haloplaca sp. 1 TL-2023]